MEEAVRGHYIALWGKPARTAWFDYPEGYRIWVYKWNPNPPPDELVFYATLGGSLHPMEGGRDPSHRIEIVIGLSSDHDDIAGTLASVADYPARNKTSLDHGHTVPGEKPLWEGTGMSDFLLLGQDDVITPLELPDRIHVHFLLAVPLYRDELEFKRQNGLETFLQRSRKVEIWDADRGPAVLSE